MTLQLQPLSGTRPATGLACMAVGKDEKDHALVVVSNKGFGTGCHVHGVTGCKRLQWSMETQWSMEHGGGDRLCAGGFDLTFFVEPAGA